ncbi:queuine tRNA-ribosyltransferase accessory subunit 2 isoform X1 [Heteronotia binoei]|uniref:queuine tRNA-ribosyltransferase accessory subunit 2 isoform X1 n=2 Tax=Heteronotia binoei TaxID=13085 RepID=UPI0029301203|nr:queuine tRNA-ribosyltransferase accessory subunit 2 isoform X1 [Heteronotia binoei]XP_060090632.1 queuine tRNA-ribosyltransferase accessory subunit 2 isoform X1 [Heteronotia binoei]
MKMKLSLSKVVSGCRLGMLTNVGKKGIQHMDIPGCLLYTKMGSAPHLTHDTLETVKDVPVVAQLPFPTLVELQEVMEEYKEGIGKFVGMPDSVVYCSLHDPAVISPSGYNNNKTISIWGLGGRMEMTPAKFMTIQRALQPDWFQCLSDGDTIAGEVSKKRAKKSVDRSLSFLDECLRLQVEFPELQRSVMIGVIEGGDVLEERLRSARETAKRPVGGFLLDSFQGNAMAKDTKLELLSSAVAELPEDKPRLIHGIGRPDEVLELIERGVDVFESCFPYQVTERGCALSFSYSYHQDPDGGVLKEDEEPDMEESKDKKTKNKILGGAEGMTAFEICLKEKRYQDDFGPLVSGCSCYCCQNHSRAYVHHLLMTKELLAGVLLMMHNFQHYFAFFRSIRDALKEDRLEKLKEIIFRQAVQAPQIHRV